MLNYQRVSPWFFKTENHPGLLDPLLTDPLQFDQDFGTETHLLLARPKFYCMMCVFFQQKFEVNKSKTY